jgi:hypothetical protein
MVVPTQAHQIGTNTISASPIPAHEWSWCSSAVTWVTANTNTRSKKSSAQVTRFSAPSGSAPAEPPAALTRSSGLVRTRSP